MDEKNVEAAPDREVKSDEHDLDRKCEECREAKNVENLFRLLT